MPLPYLYPATLPYGSRTITINFGGGGTANVVLESFEPTEGTWEVNRQNELGAPFGFGLGAEPKTATATAQLASTSSTYVRAGDTTSISVFGTSVTFVVTQVSAPEASREAKKQSLTLREVI